MRIFEMTERFYFLPTDKYVKLFCYLARLLLSTDPGGSRDWGTQMDGREESGHGQLTSELEFLVMPQMFPLAVKGLCQVSLELLERLDLMEGDGRV